MILKVNVVFRSGIHTIFFIGVDVSDAKEACKKFVIGWNEVKHFSFVDAVTGEAMFVRTDHADLVGVTPYLPPA